MSIFDILSLVCGLALFLFGMNYMGDTLKKSAGGRLKQFLGNITSNPLKGFLLGMGVTAVIQSSSATTVMVVGFVNSSAMTLSQAISVIMGANIGTCITSWITGLSGIGSGGAAVDSILQWFKPMSFTPILALIGVLLYMLSKNDQKKNVGMILLGFSVLMVGMDTMATAVKPLSESESFKNILLLFQNPFLGVLAGMIMTAVIQSSSAAVGILQSFTVTGAITFGNAIPIIMGQNIGTCVTAMLSSIGASKNAKRTAFVHLYFNVIGTIACLLGFYALNSIFRFAFVESSLGMWGIAVVHTLFNIVSVLILFPFRGMLEKLVCKTIRDKNGENDVGNMITLDERFLATPSVAIERCIEAVGEMAHASRDAFLTSTELLTEYSTEKVETVEQMEKVADQYEDMIGSYLIRLTSNNLLSRESRETTKLLHLIGDFERISDHAVNIAESANEIHDKAIIFSEEAQKELNIIKSAVCEIVILTMEAFDENDIGKALLVEPLEEVVDELRNRIRYHHILRLQRNECTIENGFVLSDLLTNYERVADHCSNIAGCMIEIARFKSLEMHNYSEHIRENDHDFDKHYQAFLEKYKIEA